jgi:flagellar biosynthesis/type III secretory pathway ATPase
LPELRFVADVPGYGIGIGWMRSFAGDATAGQAAQPAVTPASSASRSQLAQPTSGQLPSAAELRELIALKQELNRMYREGGAMRSNEPAVPPPMQEQ